MEAVARVSPERFSSGKTAEEFVNSMRKNREIWEHNYGDFQPAAEDIEFFGGLKKSYKVLVLAEDWCGDVLRYVPALTKIVELAPRLEVRFLLRDENLDLADAWRKDGVHRAIPVVVVFDAEMNELGRFIEKPAAVYIEEAEVRQLFARENPDLSDASAPSDAMSDSTHEQYVAFLRQFRSANKRRWQQMFVDDLRAIFTVAESR